jgi:hypothetical protein
MRKGEFSIESLSGSVSQIITINPKRKHIFCIHTYHTRFIPEGVAETSQVLLQDTHILNNLAMRNTADLTGGKPIGICLRCHHHH